MNKLFLIFVLLATLVGCQSVGKIAVKATPNPLHPDRFEYTVELIPQFSYTR